MKKIDIINLGCSKNLVDAELLFTQLKSNGAKVQLNPDTLTGDIAIINTCGFIGDAKEESIDTILETLQIKQTNPAAKVYVMGCLSQRYKADLEKEIPEVDQYYGVNDLSKIIFDLGYSYQQEKLLSRLHSTAPHYAYLKIAEGCDRNCSFCAIPMIRGKQVSKPIDDLVEEARFLSDHGVKELILISQELTRYGIDLYNQPELERLIRELSRVSGIEWIRLHYTYPNKFSDQLIESIAYLEKVCHYLDMPFQHFNDQVLSNMRRGHTRDDAMRLIDKIRKRIPDLALRTTLLVGHPGETEEAYEELLRDVQHIRFDRLGIFTYSHEEDTYAYQNFDDSIAREVKMERADRIMKEQQRISLEINENKIGSIQKVIIDKIEDDYYIGRTQYDSPEIDNEVLVPVAHAKLELGSFFDIRITDAREFDLFGESIT